MRDYFDGINVYGLQKCKIRNQKAKAPAPNRAYAVSGPPSKKLGPPPNPHTPPSTGVWV